MLTMKHINDCPGGGRSEFCQQINSYQVKQKDGYFQFLSFENSESDTPGVHAGWLSPEKLTNPVVANIYVMNSAGATVASHRYLMESAEVPPLWTELPDEASTEVED